MSYVDWHVGMKVVCVDGHPLHLTEGRVYTIAYLGEAFVRLQEPETWGDGGFATAGWYYYRFRKAVTRETDISVFTNMLIKQKEDA